MGERRSEHLAAALARATRDIRRYAAETEVTALAAKLEESLSLYWGRPWN